MSNNTTVLDILTFDAGANHKEAEVLEIIDSFIADTVKYQDRFPEPNEEYIAGMEDLRDWVISKLTIISPAPPES